MSEIERILDQMRRAFEGEAWHGPSVREVLTGVNSLAAAARPVDAAHTIWETVLHITAWKKTVQMRLAGGAVELTAEQDWPPAPEPSEANWNTALEALDRAHQALLAAASRITGSRLAETAPGKDYSLYIMLHGSIQHDIYHAGQIALLQRTF